MGETARMAPQRVKVSSRRQIAISAKAYKDMGFTEYALIEQTDEGLLIAPFLLHRSTLHCYSAPWQTATP